MNEYDEMSQRAEVETENKMLRLAEDIENNRDLTRCPKGHGAYYWLEEGWFLVGCKECGLAAAAFQDIEQAKKDWNAMMRIKS